MDVSNRAIGAKKNQALSDDLKTVVKSLFQAQGYEDAVRQDISSFPGADLQKPILQGVLQFALDKASTEIDLRKVERSRSRGRG